MKSFYCDFDGRVYLVIPGEDTESIKEAIIKAFKSMDIKGIKNVKIHHCVTVPNFRVDCSKTYAVITHMSGVVLADCKEEALGKWENCVECAKASIIPEDGHNITKEQEVGDTYHIQESVNDKVAYDDVITSEIYGKKYLGGIVPVDLLEGFSGPIDIFLADQ